MAQFETMSNRVFRATTTVIQKEAFARVRLFFNDSALRCVCLCMPCTPPFFSILSDCLPNVQTRGVNSVYPCDTQNMNKIPLRMAQFEIMSNRVFRATTTGIQKEAFARVRLFFNDSALRCVALRLCMPCTAPFSPILSDCLPNVQTRGVNSVYPCDT